MCEIIFFEKRYFEAAKRGIPCDGGPRNAATDDGEVDHQPTGSGGRLIFNITDSGGGFDVQKILKEGAKEFSGRGLPLLIKLCDSVDYFDNGSGVKAVYNWNHDDIPE